MPLPSAFVGGLPGGMEIAVLFLNIVIFVAIGYVVLSIVRGVGGSQRGDLEDRVANLEGQVEVLREELRDHEGD